MNSRSVNNKEFLPLKEGFICMIDVLGYKNLEFEKVRDLWENISERLNMTKTELAKANIKLDTVFLSDTIILFFSLDVVSKDVNYSSLDTDYLLILLSLVFFVSSVLLVTGLKCGILLRGALSYGEFVVDNKLNLFHGKGMLEAHKWYESTEWSGIIVSPSLEFLIDSLVSEIESSLLTKFITKYSKIPFKNGFDNSAKYAIKWIDTDVVKNKKNTVLPLNKYLSSASRLLLSPDVMNKIRNTNEFIEFINLS